MGSVKELAYDEANKDWIWQEHTCNELVSMAQELSESGEESMSLASNLHYCNALVPVDPGVISLDDSRLCKHAPKWKVVYSYGVRYYCTRHKNMYQQRAIEVTALNDCENV